MEFVTGISELEAALLKLQWAQFQRSRKAMIRVMRFLAARAQEEHSYTNRTGDTERTTVGQVISANMDEIVGALSAGMPYDVFLELARGGKWAFLWPTFTRHQDEVIAMLAAEGALDAIAGLENLSEELKAT